MQFTYDGYKFLLKMLVANEYKIVGYDEYQAFDSCAILRHDIDYSLEKAVEISKVESELWKSIEGKSTFFIMISHELYNSFTLRAKEILQEIQSHGNEIGLHFSEHRYPELKKHDLVEKILMEAKILEEIAGTKISKVSMHDPSKDILDANLEIPGMINAYSKIFFHGFKYVSDSNGKWKEPAEEYIKTKKYSRLQILTHPLWWNEEEKDVHDTLAGFINGANLERYELFVKYGFYGLEEVFSKDEVRR